MEIILEVGSVLSYLNVILLETITLWFDNLHFLYHLMMVFVIKEQNIIFYSHLNMVNFLEKKKMFNKI